MNVVGLLSVLGVFCIGEIFEAYFRQRQREDYANMARIVCRVFFWAYVLNMGYLLLREAAATLRLFP
jgi:hypothetical protein